MAKVAGTPVKREERFDAVRLPKRVRPNAPFFLGHLPQIWDAVPTEMEDGVVKAIEWLPVLGTIPIDPGCNGVEKVGRSRPNYEPAIAKWQGKGGVVLRHGDPRLGEDCDYMAVFKHVSGQPVYRDVWTEMDILGHEVEESVSEDEYNAFRRMLVEKRIVEPIDPMVQRRILRVKERRVERLIDQIGSRPGHTGLQDKLDQAQGWVDAIRASMAEPVKRSGSRRKARATKTASVDEALGATA